jgi:uncharacterized protein (TIGR02588 family)
MPKKPAPREESRAKRRLETIAAAIGAILAVATLAIIAWDGIADQGRPALITLRAEAVHPHENGFVIEIVAHNGGDDTAAELLVEGALQQGGEIVETSEVLFDYVPSRSSRRGALYFRQDPRQFALQLRAKGYREP